MLELLLLCLFTGFFTIDDFNQLHDWNGVHEMHSDDFVWAIGSICNGCDRNGGSVGRKNSHAVAPDGIEFL